MFAKLRLFGLALLSIALVSGCGGRNAAVAAKVSGSVTYNGSALPGGTIVFHVKDAEGKPVGVYQGAIGADGSYTIVDMPAGDAVVTVDTEGLNPNKKTPDYKMGGHKEGARMSPMPESAKGQGAGSYVKIPAKYAAAATSDLTTKLTKGSNTYKPELRD